MCITPIIYNFYYGKNLQILSAEITISRLARVLFSRFLGLRRNLETVSFLLSTDR